MGKKAVAIIIILALISVNAFAFSDAKGHWAEKYALSLFDLGIFKGDDNGNANLADDIKRIEFLALLIRAVYKEADFPPGDKSFVDVSHGSWYYDIASFAKQKGIVLGDEFGNLLPENNIKREEIVLMVVRALELKGGRADFTDIDEGYIYYNEVCAAVENKIINGYEDGSFNPKNPATRGEAATIIARMLGIEFETPVLEKINLTWHHLSKTGITDTGALMDGLNVVSPTWFRIRSFSDEKPAPYEYKLDGDNIYYLQDIGNEQYIKDAHKKGYKVWALFKSNDFSPRNNSGFLNDDAARKSAIELMRKMIDKYSLDGINMDFENMLVEDKDIYTQFVKEMGEMMRDTGAVLSVDVTKYSPMGGTWSMCYDRAEIAKYADYVALMAYDQNGASSQKAGSVGDLKWVEDAVLKTLEEVPAEKLILGIPFYTRLWQSQNGKVIKTSAIGMQTAQNVLDENDVNAVYDESTGQNYASWETNGVLFEIWLEDETSIKNRIALTKKYNLAGIASWSKDFANSSIWEFINNEIKE
ncbi:MAG: glycosyl hydrolase family 18 protein [Firmicutes bacterium]|nr:glycosyl hydrolase family 18 protein [Bacillota bacterium]